MRLDDLRDDVAALLDEHHVARGGCPCARSPARCAASQARSWSPASRTGSSTANGVTAPVRPTLTSMASSRVVACCAGNLKAIAQRGNFSVAPSRSRAARSSTLMTTPSVSKSRPWRASAQSRADRRRPPRCRRSAPSAARPAGPSPRSCSSTAACVRQRCGGASRCGHELVHERRRGAAAPRPPDRGCASCRPRRCGDWRTAARRPPPARGSCARTRRAAGRSRRAPRSDPRASPRSRSGIARIVRTFDVTSSPSHAVAPRHAANRGPRRLVGQRDAQAVDLQLGHVGARGRRTGAPCARARRRRAAPSSS